MNKFSTIMVLVLLCFGSKTFAQHFCTIPYDRNIGGGKLDACWKTEPISKPKLRSHRYRSTSSEGVQTSAQHSRELAKNANFLMMGEPWAKTTVFLRSQLNNVKFLHLNFAGKRRIRLQFSAKTNSQDTYRQPATVYFSDDGGQRFVGVKLLPIVNPFSSHQSNYAKYRLNLDQMAVVADLRFNDQWVIGFEHVRGSQYSPPEDVTISHVAVETPLFPIPAYPAETLDITKRTITNCPFWRAECARSTPCDANHCPYVLDFDKTLLNPHLELMSIDGAEMRVERDKKGFYLRLHAKNYTYGDPINVALLRFDFTDIGQSHSVKLEFSWKAFDQQSNKFDGVYFSDDGGRQFVKVHDLDRTKAPIDQWMNVVLVLNELASQHGLAFSEDFVIAFEHYAPNDSGRQGYAIDNIRIGL